MSNLLTGVAALLVLIAFLYKANKIWFELEAWIKREDSAWQKFQKGIMRADRFLYPPA